MLSIVSILHSFQLIEAIEPECVLPSPLLSGDKHNTMYVLKETEMLAREIRCNPMHTKDE
ncbi:hypothetical protein KTT_53160 [Tengunoibacter tsumagoiensis]|uniref:Uncharacterized protein n=1 Tax=Tengunoibacter tsumagoiensis TaxID=2014871 RepID=A0A402A8H6_9CHLR|nr:hypothetical protein KTT_53160 [Tengunoibacter tsumagoiensis]